MSKKKYDYCVFIGRMQPPHKAHIQNIRTALELSDRVIVIFGSHRAARNPKNPWTAKEREDMVRCCFRNDENERIICSTVRDYYYNDNVWVADVQQRVAEAISQTEADTLDEEALYEGRGFPRIALLGLYKDHSSYYLDLFPQWKREVVSSKMDTLNATDVRNIYFSYADEAKQLDNMVEFTTQNYIHTWIHDNADLFAKLAAEWKYYKGYKEEAKRYPTTFVTTDTVVVKSGHVLLIRRRVNPGKGLLALPGGFAKQELTLLNNALEELKEETRITMSKDELLKHLKNEKVFDHPGRSLRGRTVTHSFYFELPNGELPKVKGDDDAEHAMWVPITEVFAREDEMFEDHVHIINYFYSKAR